eukprot:TRINITY_DN5462_c0_g1_i1.p1 TRINITY_DN5462_c0_g1~~TRINITY_DN5462_c0_g1_i1.p1  ORF type:complete len:124 (+),score=2.58 TRINITY_DN5462_c0_g1_i1:637-1008(+)
MAHCFAALTPIKSIRNPSSACIRFLVIGCSLLKTRKHFLPSSVVYLIWTWNGNDFIPLYWVNFSRLTVYPNVISVSATMFPRSCINLLCFSSPRKNKPSWRNIVHVTCVAMIGVVKIEEKFLF